MFSRRPRFLEAQFVAARDVNFTHVDQCNQGQPKPIRQRLSVESAVAFVA